MEWTIVIEGSLMGASVLIEKHNIRYPIGDSIDIASIGAVLMFGGVRQEVTLRTFQISSQVELSGLEARMAELDLRRPSPEEAIWGIIGISQEDVGDEPIIFPVQPGIHDNLSPEARAMCSIEVEWSGILQQKCIRLCSNSLGFLPGTTLAGVVLS